MQVLVVKFAAASSLDWVSLRLKLKKKLYFFYVF